jgi:hypothetical protein
MCFRCRVKGSNLDLFKNVFILEDFKSSIIWIVVGFSSTLTGKQKSRTGQPKELNNVFYN